MDDLIVDFIAETNESLAALDNDIVRLEQNPNDKNLISGIFRLMHTIKGTCGFLGLERLQHVAHAAENVLGRYRDGDLQVTASSVSLILESIDRVRYIMAVLEEQGKEPEGSDAELIGRLDAVYEGRDEGAMPMAASPQHQDVDVTQTEKLDTVLLAESPPLSKEGVDVKLPAKPDDDHQPTRESSVANQSLRVNVDVLEDLMNMVSELVLTRNQLLQIMRTQKENDFGASLQRLNQVVSELQEGVMKTRMQPIGNAWAKLPRIIRDLSIELGKKIDLDMIGQDTELDRQILDMIKDPLTHMIRNSADHGIEMPAERAKAGKPETGKITLKAYHEGGHIIIQIIDDGKGLSVERIKKKAVENKLATPEDIAKMSDHQIYQFIFRAGFSTAEKVTAVSGRGVGMDVVRTNIEKIGGSIELKSAEGKGSTFTIKIPLTLAIVSALIVESGGERFAIPQLSVRELVMVAPGSDNRIEMIKGVPLFRLRDHLLPLVSLSRLLGIGNHDDIGQNDNSSRREYIVVMHVGAYVFGVIVDRVFDTEEIVVKPVSRLLSNIEIYAGNTILGDGSVIMILDPLGLAKTNGDIDLSDTKAQQLAENEMAARSQQKTPLILFSAGNDAPKAVPLALVSRLERINTASIEKSADTYVMQYRGSLMHLMPFNSDITLNDTQKPALVFQDRGHNLGILVNDIIDIVEENLNLEIMSDQPGLMGSAIIAGKATDVVDVSYYLQKINAEWFRNHAREPYHMNRNATGDNKRRILLVDDSPFFHNMLIPLLKVAGYDVTAVDSALEALRLCEQGVKFDVIVSDIEMPMMDGFEFAAKIKADSNWKDVPMVALTSHAEPQDIAHGLGIGFEKYIAKFDRDTLLSTLSEALNEGLEGRQL